MLRSTSSASPTQRDAASKPIAAVLVDVPGIPESATSASPSSRMQSQGISDSRECRVHFEDTPEIVLFLSEEDTTEIPEARFLSSTLLPFLFWGPFI